MSSAPFFLTAPAFRKESGVRHAFFGRTAQTGERARALQLQETARRALGVEHALGVKQVHSARVVVVREADDRWRSSQPPPEADALVTSVPNLLLCVYTADCAPVLLFEPYARVCAALHAGWRGALTGIVQQTVRSMRTLGAHEKRTLAVVGPTIAPASYPVSDEFPKPFLEQSAQNSRFFVRNHSKWHFDLPAYVRGCLHECGIASVQNLCDDRGEERADDGELDWEEGSGIDTFSDRRFFSHRRALREGAGEKGSNISCVALER